MIVATRRQLKMKLSDRLTLLRNAGIIPIAVSYARYSSANQRDESIDAQQRAIRDFASANKIVISQEYVDRAKSATTDDREAFRQMISDSAAKNFHFVIVHKMDRFSRNRSDSLGYKVELRKNGVFVLSVLEQFDLDTPEGAFMEGIVELMAEFYSKNLSREVMKGLKENAIAAKFNGGSPPLGYDINHETQKYVINQAEAESVKLIFSMIQKRYTYDDILIALHSKGYRTKAGNYFKRNSLYDILRNPRYTGKYIYQRVASKDPLTKTRNNHLYNPEPIVIPNGLPAIIPQDVFDEVQKVLDARSHKRARRFKENYLLSGRIYCGECKKPYVGDRTILKSGKPYITYRCSSRKNKVGIKCNNSTIMRDDLEREVIKTIEEIIFDEHLLQNLLAKYNTALQNINDSTYQTISNINAKISGISNSINNIIKAIETSGSQTLLTRLAELETQKAQLEQQCKEIKNENLVTPIDMKKFQALITSAKKILYQPGFASTRRLVDTFIEKVEVYKDRIEIKLNAAPFILKGDYTKYSKIILRK